MVFENIRNLREDCDKKQQEIADYLHIKQSTSIPHHCETLVPFLVTYAF